MSQEARSEALIEVLEALQESDIGFVLVGGYAVSQFETRFSTDLECPDKIRQCARTLAEQAEEHGVTTGVHPAGFVAVCLYKAGREEERWLTKPKLQEPIISQRQRFGTIETHYNNWTMSIEWAPRAIQKSEEHLQKAEVR